MKLTSKILTLSGVVAGLVLLGVVLGWLGSRTPATQTASSPDGLAPLEFQPAETGPALVEHRPKTRPVPQLSPLPTGPEVAMGDQATNWEERVEAILTSDASEADKAKKLFALFPNLPEDGQVEVAQHLANLVVNADYAPLGQMLTNAGTPDSVLDVLMSDVLNRPNSMKLPLLLSMARNENHPKSGEARDLLQLYLEQDYADDWNQWQASMEQWLRANPD